LKVRAYNPIAFVMQANPTVLGESMVDDTGCYTIDGLSRGSLTQGLVAVSATDASSPMGGTYAVMGVGSPLPPGRNVTDLQAYYVEKQTVDTWEMQVGATLYASGMWMGWYLDPTGHAVTGVTPSRPPGDDPLPSAVFCFRGDRMTLSTEDTTDATGICLISPDYVENHSGSCGGSALPDHARRDRAERDLLSTHAATDVISADRRSSEIPSSSRGRRSRARWWCRCSRDR